jgi:PAS domain S-box-containing protein
MGDGGGSVSTESLESVSELERYRILIDAETDYAIYMLDPEGRVASWNPGAQRFKGYRAQEILGQHFSRFYTDEDRARDMPRRALETAAKSGRFEAEGWRVRKDGSRFWAHVIVDPIFSPEGKLLGFAKITRDLTERMESQRQLDAAREQLIQSQKMESLGQLTGGIAHDFNNLLTAILGSLEIARKRVPNDPRILRLLDNAIQGAQRGASLTQRMLAFARRQDLNLVAVDLAELVRGMMDLIQSSIGPSYTIETRFPLNLEKMCADENQIELALLNLAVNARDAMPKGGSIVITADAVEVGADEIPNLAGGRYVRLAVTDSGEGMDEATLARAIEPFFTTKGPGRGTGLGLSVVHGVAIQSGGRLLMKSRIGEGTTAELWMPVYSGRATATEQEEGEAATTQGLTVLAVDDDALVLMNTVAMLEDLGHFPLEANSGAEALELLRSNRVDLVITDQAMPRMSGTQLIDAIRSEWPDMSIVLATGYAELPEGTPPGVTRLAKPFTLAQVARLIDQVCG